MMRKFLKVMFRLQKHLITLKGFAEVDTSDLLSKGFYLDSLRIILKKFLSLIYIKLFRKII